MPFTSLPLDTAILYDHKERQYYAYRPGKPRRPLGDCYAQTPMHPTLDAPNWPAIDQAIETLNRSLHSDAESTNALLNARVQVNAKLLHDPTIQAGVKDGVAEATVFGLLNGLFGITHTGYGYITAVTTDDGTERIIHFRRTDEALLGLKHP